MTTTDAIAYFTARLAHQTDPADLAAARAAGDAPLLVDVRSAAAWAQGRIPGAVHAPLPELVDRAAELLRDPDAPVVVYCWGPGCNASTKAALLLARLGGTAVRELVGGYEYWVREGFAVVGDGGRHRRLPDPLTAPLDAGPR